MSAPRTAWRLRLVNVRSQNRALTGSVGPGLVRTLIAPLWRVPFGCIDRPFGTPNEPSGAPDEAADVVSEDWVNSVLGCRATA